MVIRKTISFKIEVFDFIEDQRGNKNRSKYINEFFEKIMGDFEW